MRRCGESGGLGQRGWGEGNHLGASAPASALTAVRSKPLAGGAKLAAKLTEATPHGLTNHVSTLALSSAIAR